MNAYRTPLVLGVIIVALMIGGIWYMTRSHSVASAGPFMLGEFGILIDTPPELNDLAYETIPQDAGSVLHMQTKTIRDTADRPCELGIFYEVRKDAAGKSDTRWSAAALQAGKFERDNTPAQVKEFSDFYLIFEPSQSLCARTEQGARAEAEKRVALWNALSTARFAQ